jgi:hypothetical protein
MRNLSNNGIQFENLNDTPRRGQVVGYHCKPDPVDRSKAEQMDVNGLKPVDRQNVKIDGAEFESRFKIGMEFEKTRFNRAAVQEYPLLCGFERDSSCGVEAITHILPLIGPSMWRTKVFNMFHEARKIIDDNYSPSNVKCGGHITLSVDGMDGAELMSKVRKFAPVILAIFRHRLSNRYCNGNPQMLPMGEGVNSRGSRKYVVCKDTGFGIEFRLPSRFTSVKQTIRRYEIMYHLLDFAVNKPNATLRKFHHTLKPILISMYDGDIDRVNTVLELTKHFAKFMKTGRVNIHTAPWLEGWWSTRQRQWGAYRQHYQRNFRPTSVMGSEWIEAHRV